jgi:hypothetical protein
MVGPAPQEIMVVRSYINVFAISFERDVFRAIMDIGACASSLADDRTRTRRRDSIVSPNDANSRRTALASRLDK